MRTEGSVIDTAQGARFVADAAPDHQVRLTAIPMQDPRPPVEIDLRAYVGKRIAFECGVLAEDWAYGTYGGIELL